MKYAKESIFVFHLKKQYDLLYETGMYRRSLNSPSLRHLHSLPSHPEGLASPVKKTNSPQFKERKSREATQNNTLKE